MPGKDSWRLGHAGAEAYLVDSPRDYAFVAELSGEAGRADLVVRFFTGLDIVVVEGHKLQAPYKWRPSVAPPATNGRSANRARRSPS